MRTFSNDRGGFGFNIQMTPGVKGLLIVNFAIFVVQVFFPGMAFWFGLVPYLVVRGCIWQLFTYMFLHATGGHIIFNMWTLWMFGTVIEGTWGMQRFLRYYMICGTGAAVCAVLAAYLIKGSTTIPTIGASGAIFGLLLAFGVMFPNAPILLFFILPMPAKYVVILYGAFSLVMFSSNAGGNTSHIAHLGGLLVGYIYMRYAGFTRRPSGYFQRRFSLSSSLAGWRGKYQAWNRRRLRKKFEVYLRDQDRNNHIN